MFLFFFVLHKIKEKSPPPIFYMYNNNNNCTFNPEVLLVSPKSIELQLIVQILKIIGNIKVQLR